MTTQKKISAIVLAIIGIVAAVCMLFGIYGVWWTAGTVNTAALSILSSVENNARQSSELLTQVDTAVGSVQTNVSDIETRVATVGVNLSENPVILNALRQQYDERASPELRTLLQSARAARVALARTASLAAAANANPFTATFAPDMARAQALDAALDEVEQELLRVGLEIRDLKVDATQAVTGGITSRLQRIDGALQVARDATNDLNQRANTTMTNAVARQASFPSTVNMLAFGITVVMAAALIGGVALAWSSISYLQSGGRRIETFLGRFSANVG